MKRFLVPGLILLAGAVTLVVAGSDEVAALVAAARYDEARAELAADAVARSTVPGLALAARLERDPAAALATLAEARAAAADGSAESHLVILDAAAIELGGYRPAAALALLEPLLSGDRTDLPGQALLLGGLAARATGDDKHAERLLSGVRQGDPAFAEARLLLGEISMDRGDAERALRYFTTEGVGPRAEGGRWQALRQLGDDRAAAQVLADMTEKDAGGLALLDVRRRQRTADDEEAARFATTDGAATTDTVATRPVTGGRYTLQLGAWSDRSRALDMVRRYADELPDLHIEETRDDRGQILYKVRLGSYDNPALARSEAGRLRSRLDLDVFVTDRSE